MPVLSDQPATANSVDAAVKYLADAKDIPTYVASAGGGDTSIHGGNYIIQTVAIENGRLRAEGCTLDREGFALVAAPSTVGDFYDDAQITATYEAEVEALLRRETGARRVDIFDHTRRATSVDVQETRQIREPASLVHGDYTDRSGPVRLRDHFAAAPEEAEALLARRFAIVNVWRSIAGTVRRGPLALCDAASVAPEDLVSVERQARDRIGEIQQAVFNPAHRWVYFPEMTMDEALLIKTFDSATDGRARRAVHTAIDDPDTPDDAPSRESIETRAFVFF